MDKNNLISAIVAAVNDSWDKNKKAILLSKLGSLQSSELARSAKALGCSLSDFIAENLQEKVVLIKHSVMPIKLGAIPIGKIDTSDPIKIDEALTSGMAGDPVRFIPGLWWAFKNHAEAGKNRIVLITDGKVQASEIVENAALPKHAYLIDHKWLQSANVDGSEKNIYDAIIGWANEQGIEPTSLAQQRHKDGQPSHQGAPVSVLDLMLKSIGESNLKRVAMPLDIVYLLSKTKR